MYEYHRKYYIEDNKSILRVKIPCIRGGQLEYNILL